MTLRDTGVVEMLKFIGLLVWRGILNPLLSVVALPFLLIAMAILGVVIFFMQTWKDAHEH